MNHESEPLNWNTDHMSEIWKFIFQPHGNKGRKRGAEATIPQLPVTPVGKENASPSQANLETASQAETEVGSQPVGASPVYLDQEDASESDSDVNFSATMIPPSQTSKRSILFTSPAASPPSPMVFSQEYSESQPASQRVFRPPSPLPFDQHDVTKVNSIYIVCRHEKVKNIKEVTNSRLRALCKSLKISNSQRRNRADTVFDIAKAMIEQGVMIVNSPQFDLSKVIAGKDLDV